MGLRGKACSATLLLPFEAPERSGFQLWRGNIFEGCRRALENRLLDAAYVAGYASDVWEQCAPPVRVAAGQVTRVVTNPVVNRWLLVWTLAAIWLCY
jgi:hypothetical protein